MMFVFHKHWMSVHSMDPRSCRLGQIHFLIRWKKSDFSLNRFSSVYVSGYLLHLVGEQSIAISLTVCLWVCVYVCLSVSEHISETVGPIFMKSCAYPCGHGSILLWRRCNTLCTSSFMDDVVFGCNGQYGDYRRWNIGAESDVYECLVCNLFI